MCDNMYQKIAGLDVDSGDDVLLQTSTRVVRPPSGPSHFLGVGIRKMWGPDTPRVSWQVVLGQVNLIGAYRAVAEAS